MTLFEMNEAQDQLMSILCDPMTGEINEEVYDQIQQLEIDRNEKIDGWCFYLKQKASELAAAKSILDEAKKRYETMESSYNRLRARFETLMEGEKFKSTFNTVYYRINESVVLDDGMDVRDIAEDYLAYNPPTLKKSEIKAALKLGKKVAGVHLQTSTSMVIK